MAAIGERLRQERRRQSLDLEAVANQTRIRRQFLEAIESEEWDRLPGKFFVKNFLCQYARVLGVDARELDPELERLFEGEEPGLAVEPRLGRQGIRVPPFSTQRRRGGFRQRRWLPYLVLIVGVGLLGWGGYAFWQRVGQAPSGPAERQTTRYRPRTRPVTSSEPERRVEEGSLPYVSGQVLPPENPPALPQPVKLRVNLVATESTWVSVRVDGGEVFSGILNPGDRRSFEGTGMVRLHIGNAGGLEVQWNGKPVGSIGRRGEVCFVDFGLEEFQIRKTEM